MKYELLEALKAAVSEIESRDRGFMKVHGVPYDSRVDISTLRHVIMKAERDLLLGSVR